MYARSDRSRRLRTIGTDERQDVDRGQRRAVPWRPDAVRTGEHQPRRLEGAVAGREQLRSELANKTSYPGDVRTWSAAAGHQFLRRRPERVAR